MGIQEAPRLFLTSENLRESEQAGGDDDTDGDGVNGEWQTLFDRRQVKS